MTAALSLLRGERRARRFFLAHTQSSLGSGAAYVALLLLAYDRFRSPWAITLVLLADFAPAIALGPLLGAAVDRFGRRRCAVIADAVRAMAFAGIWLAPSFPLTVALALLAGVGTALFKPAILAGLPSLVDDERLPAATSLYGAIADLGHTLGPALAGGALLITGPRVLLLVNAITFAVSALAVARIDFGTAGSGSRRRSLVAEARDGISVTMGMPAIRTLLIGSSLAVLAAGMTNVGELQLAKDSFGAGSAGLSIFVALSGVGIVAGSLVAGGAGGAGGLKRRYLLGLLAMSAAMLVAGLAPMFALASVAFAALGSGNGLASVSEQLLVQRTVPDELLGRAFGVKSALISGAFGASLMLGGLVTSLAGPRALFAIAGAGLLLAVAWSSVRLRSEWAEEPRPEAAAPQPAAA